jgi:hypothetical protein
VAGAALETGERRGRVERAGVICYYSAFNVGLFQSSRCWTSQRVL